MIQLKNVNKKFGNKEILNNFNYIFNDSGFYVIKGKNGSGKTTLLNIISGLVEKDSGDIYYNGVLLKSKKFFDIRKKEVSYIFQNLNLNKKINVENNLKLGFLAGNSSYKEFYDRQREVLKRLNISKLRFQKVNNLSGGEKTRVTIARALIKGSKVILCDEPTSSLDPKNAENVYDILRELSKDHLIILVTHDSTFLKEIENDKSISIIDMDKKVVTKEEKIIINNNYKIDKIHSKHIFKRTTYFFRNYLLSSFLFLMLLSIIIVILSVFVQYQSQNEFDYYNQYVNDNNVDVSFLSDKYTDISTYQVDGTSYGYDECYLDTVFEYDPEFRTVSDTDTTFDCLDESNIYTVFEKGFFDNIRIDDSLDENEINLTSILYDYLDAYGKIDGSNIYLGNVELTINDVYDVDYSNVNDDTIDDETGYYNLEYYQKAVYMTYNTYENILAFVPDSYFELSDTKGIASNEFIRGTYTFYNVDYSGVTDDDLYESEKSIEELDDGEVIAGFDVSDIGGTLELITNYSSDSSTDQNTYSYDIVGVVNTVGDVIMTYDDYCALYEAEYSESIGDMYYYIDNSSSNLETTFNETIDDGLYMYFVNADNFYLNYTNLSIQFSFIYQFFYFAVVLYFIGLALIVLFYRMSNKKNIALLLSTGYTKQDITIQGMISNLSFIILSIPISYFLSRYLYLLIRNKIESTLDISIIPVFENYLFIIIFIVAFIILEVSTLIFTTRFKKNIYKELND